ncbi:DUF6551 family protein [Streptomyces sp. 769]|uniref:DUF6551 family protein n=1 Tax=Streptomyces sp. 769 TaxID=1262452 RepID=UPI00057C3B52|nr:DUF6551 family protein [Streptomyces sp. 769]AJC54998.1 ParB domain protein nuclease [Streptomyces sp. 769]
MIDFLTIKMIRVDDLIRDAEYQRKLDRARARKIAGTFDVRIFDPITVSPRPGGKWAVIDGNTRSYAAELLGYAKLPATISPEKSVAEEAQLFSRKSSGQKKLTATEQFHADVIANVKDAVVIDMLLTAHGWTLGSDIKCVGALRRCYGFYGAEAVDRTLRTLRPVITGRYAETWLVGGVAALIGKWPEVSDERIQRTLEKYLLHIKRGVEARGELGSGNRAGTAAEVIRDYYNKGLGSTSRSRLPDASVPKN